MICKGFAVSFDLVGGEQVDATAGYALLHDPTGRDWKRTSVLVAPFHRDGVEVDPSGAAKDYLGARHNTKAGSIDLPPKALGAWSYEGVVEAIYYRRHGSKFGGRRFVHRFNEPSLARLIKGRGKARLYSRGRLFRLELSRGAILDSRGFVFP